LEDDLETLGLEALVSRLRDLSPRTADETDLQNPVRVRRALERLMEDRPTIPIDLPPFQKFKLALNPPVDVLNGRLEDRTAKLLARGWIEEVESLQARGITEDHAAMRAIGYRTLLRVVLGHLELSEALARIQIDTRQYAKRQRTWLRSEPNLRLLDGLDFGTLIEESLKVLKSRSR
jgi:tRNA dimethylallyltransferase